MLRTFPLRRRLRQLLDLRLVRLEASHALPERVHLRRIVARLGIDFVLDIGANRGQWARMLRRQAGYRGRIVSFEPEPGAAEALRRLAARDPLWEVDARAVSVRPGRAAFNVMRDRQFSSLHPPSEAETRCCAALNRVERRIEVETAPLADLLAEYRARFGFSRPMLKMDTQGHDLAIAQAAGDALGSFVAIQTELAVSRLYEGAAAMPEAIGFYDRAGFTLSALVPNNAGHFPRLVEIDGIFVRNDTPGLC